MRHPVSEKKVSLKGKVVLVTGAGKGIGSIIAREIANHGANLAINDLTPVNLDEVESDILAKGGLVRSYIVDVSKKIPIQSLVNAVQDDLGRIDILVHCARVRPKELLMDMDDWDWQRTLDVNLTGAFLAMQSIGRVMREQGGGRMILVGPSLMNDASGRGAYLISMAALHELSTRAAAEFKQYRIQVKWIDQQNDVGQAVKNVLAACRGIDTED
jgi:NAD(P)-dependent dehydrogenase (short-subunit alcohol dehydrogenase family)